MKVVGLRTFNQIGILAVFRRRPAPCASDSLTRSWNAASSGSRLPRFCELKHVVVETLAFQAQANAVGERRRDEQLKRLC